jgi:hypothetical protein
LSWNGIWDDGSSEMKKNFKLTILKEPEIYYP